MAGKHKLGVWSTNDNQTLLRLYGVQSEEILAARFGRSVDAIRSRASKLLPEVSEQERAAWSPERMERLAVVSGHVPLGQIARGLRVSLTALVVKLEELRGQRCARVLSSRELQAFKSHYGSRGDEWLSLIHRIPVAQVEEIASQFALSKDKAYLRTIGTDASKMPRWTAAQVEKVRRMYPTVANLEIARAVGRSTKSVASLAHRLRLQKSPERLRQLGEQNVRLRYDRAI